ncbi:MAG: homocysteine S-methyltransferase family protein [Deltaproteobacteria bacterium]|nr:homocysteine S-methyltransferase family protein [Deltaproteobacteria bacterium]
MKFTNALNEQILVIDGAMGTMVQNAGLSDEAYGGPQFNMLADLLAFSRPDVLKGIHLQYLKAGANIIETNTFGASGLRLQEYDFSGLDVRAFRGLDGGINLNKLGPDEMAYHINKKAAEVAKAAVAEYLREGSSHSRPLYVAGCIGPSNWVLSSTRADLKKGTYDLILNNFYHQVNGLIDGGADVICFDTSQDQLELKVAIHGAQKAMKEKGVALPIIAHVTVDQFGRMQIFNTDVCAALSTVQDIGITVFGINCSIGPDLMEHSLKTITQHSRIPLSIMPNAGLPENENGRTIFKLKPKEFAKQVSDYASRYALNIVGGCCGTTPEHIGELAQLVRGKRPQTAHRPRAVFISGPQKAVALDSTDGLIRIGERLNVRGSKKVRDAVEREGVMDFDTLEEVVNEQVKNLGLDIIDVCMDSNQVNTEETLVNVIREMTTDFSGAMCIDSFSVDAMIKAVQAYPGRPLINSISLETHADGVDKLTAIVSRTCQHAPVYIALCADARGPAQTAHEKHAIAKKIHDKCRDEFGVRADQLIIDVNAFPIGSESVEGMNFAKESLDAISLIKAIHPDIKVSIGVGNLTNGLSKKPYMRKVITSVYLDLARKKGLDAAIINPQHYVPVESLPEGDVALARRIILDHDMEAFAKLEEVASQKKGEKKTVAVAYDTLLPEEAVCQKIRDGYKQRASGFIETDGLKYEYQDTVVIDTANALKKHEPLDFVNLFLMKAMNELGTGFGKGDVSLPHLLKAADVMKSAMGYIEAYINHRAGKGGQQKVTHKGTVILGTVYQDVHSIGKDLAKTLLENYGYKVIDLGVQTPLENFVKAAKEHNAVAVGLSALLVQTSVHMITVAKMLCDAGLGDIIILIGGAPVNQRHAVYVSLCGQNDVSKMLPHVFYCTTGMDGVNFLNQLLARGAACDELRQKNLENLKWYYEQAKSQQANSEGHLKTLPRRKVVFGGADVRKGSFITPVKIETTMREFAGHVDLKTLFSLNWRYGGRASWGKKGITEEGLVRQFNDWVAKCDEHRWIVPQFVCGVFPCVSDGDTLMVFDVIDKSLECARFDFSVLIGSDKKDIFSAAQYFRGRGDGVCDAVGMQISTAGPCVDKQVQLFKNEGDTESALLLQGLSDRIAEDMAAYAHGYLRKQMGLTGQEGARYSPGYPGLESMHVNRVIADMLSAEERMGIGLTEADEFYPTGTTAAVVCFHPQAAYG